MNSNCHKHMTLNSTSTPALRWMATPQQPITVAVAPENHLLTTREAAVILKVSEATLKKWRQRDRGPAFIKYHTGAVRYRLSVVLQFVSDCAAGR